MVEVVMEVFLKKKDKNRKIVWKNLSYTFFDDKKAQKNTIIS